MTTTTELLRDAADLDARVRAAGERLSAAEREAAAQRAEVDMWRTRCEADPGNAVAVSAVTRARHQQARAAEAREPARAELRRSATALRSARDELAARSARDADLAARIRAGDRDAIEAIAAAIERQAAGDRVLRQRIETGAAPTYRPRVVPPPTTTEHTEETSHD